MSLISMVSMFLHCQEFVDLSIGVYLSTKVFQKKKKTDQRHLQYDNNHILLLVTEKKKMFCLLRKSQLASIFSIFVYIYLVIFPLEFSTDLYVQGSPESVPIRSILQLCLLLKLLVSIIFLFLFVIIIILFFCVNTLIQITSLHQAIMKDLLY